MAFERLLTLALAGALLLPAALSASAACDGTVAKRPADGATFVADAFGYGRLPVKTRRGVVRDEVDIWRGKIDGQIRFMHVGERGTGFGSTSRAADYRGRIKWQPAFGFPMGGEWEVVSGPMRGKWSTACDRPPAAPEAEPTEDQSK